MRITSARIALEAVGATLENNEFRLGVFEICLDAFPGGVKITVARAGLQRNIELGAFGLAFTGLFLSAMLPDMCGSDRRPSVL